MCQIRDQSFFVRPNIFDFRFSITARSSFRRYAECLYRPSRSFPKLYGIKNSKTLILEDREDSIPSSINVTSIASCLVGSDCVTSNNGIAELNRFFSVESHEMQKSLNLPYFKAAISNVRVKFLLCPC